MKALVIAKDSPLLQKMLFEIIKFDPEQVLIVDPESPTFSLRSAPDIIIPVGQVALDKLEITTFGIVKVAGEILDYQGVPVVPTFGAGYVEKNPHLMQKWAEDFYRAYQTMHGITALEKTNQYIVVEDALQLMDLVDQIKKAGYVAFDFETTSLKDLKTHDPDFYCTMLSLTFQQGASYIIPLFHKDSPSSKEFIETCRKELESEVFLNPDVTKIGHYVKFDMHCLTWWGIPKVAGPIHDTIVMHYLLDEHTGHKLKKLVAEFHPRYANYEDGLGKVTEYGEINFDVLAKYAAMDSDMTFRLYWQFTERLLDEDERLYILFRNLLAPATPALFAMEQRGMLIDKEHLLSSIQAVKGIIEEVEQDMLVLPAVKTFEASRAERFMRTKAEKLEEQSKKKEASLENREWALEDRIKKLKNKIFKTDKATENNKAKVKELKQMLASMKQENIEILDDMRQPIYDFEHGKLDLTKHLTEDQLNINLASPDQMNALFYGSVGFKFDVPNDQYGRPQKSTGKDVLPLLKDKTGFVDDLLAHRQLKKILSTYLEGILARTTSKHRIHGTFNQHVAKTGRLSASDPNLQNIIKRTKYKKVEEAVAMVMKCFIPPKGMNIMQADYSQAELRLMAFYSKDPVMLQAYADGEDLHALTAATTMSLTLDEFKNLPDKEKKLYRYEAKSTNFGFIFKITPEGFMEYCRTVYGVNINLKQARERQAQFFKKYAKITDYHEESIAKAKKFGYVRTLFGQKIRLPDTYSSDSAKKGHAERNSINGRIQGTAGQMMEFAIALLYIRAPWLELVNSVHDSALPYTPPDASREMAIMKETMENLPIEEYFGKSVDTVDMKVDFESSKTSWGDLEEIV